MNILEKEIEDLVYELAVSGDKQLQEKCGIILHKNCLRQLKIGNYGVSDLICFNLIKHKNSIHINIQIVEIKKEEINIETFSQAIRYAKGIKQFLIKSLNLDKRYVEVEIILIGKTINRNLLYVTDFYCDLSLYTYELSIKNGLEFKSHFDYCLRDEDFKIKFTYSKIKEILLEADHLSKI